MAISARLLFEDWADGIGSGYGEERAQKKFIRATNMAMDDLSYDTDLATNITHITSIDGSIAIDGSFSHVMLAGISYFAAALLGVRPADPKVATVVFNSNERMWDRFKAQYARSIDNDLQPTQSDSMDALGYLDEE
jgi:uncharacterized membrane protein